MNIPVVPSIVEFSEIDRHRLYPVIDVMSVGYNRVLVKLRVQNG